MSVFHGFDIIGVGVCVLCGVRASFIGISISIEILLSCKKFLIEVKKLGEGVFVVDRV